METATKIYNPSKERSRNVKKHVGGHKIGVNVKGALLQLLPIRKTLSAQLIKTLVKRGSFFWK